MKSSGDGTNGAGQPAKPNQLATISECKLKANRENARKSTGPKTTRGKALSRRNALKHGFFVRNIRDFDALVENPQEYKQLLDGLWAQYLPIGRAEEIEVERVALCWWRLKRVWRYENAVNRAAQRDFAQRELSEQVDRGEERDKKEDVVILQLQSAKKEIEERGEISQELMQRIFTMMPGFESVWSAMELCTQEKLKKPVVSEVFAKLGPKERSSVLALHNVNRAIGFLEELRQSRWESVTEIAIGQCLVPNREVVDKILRYETTIERSLSRALDRLERLQRRHNGEALPPPLTVHLTR